MRTIICMHDMNAERTASWNEGSLAAAWVIT